jgi:hypothetical protein
VFAERQGWAICEEYMDHAVSGATLLHAGFQALMRDALNRRFDVVLAESLDRFSRDQEDTAGLFKRLTFAGVSIVTLAEGDITHLHIGFKGTMNALFLKDLAEKTHRGLRGRIEDGKSAGGLWRRVVGRREERQKATRRAVADSRNIGRARRPQYLFSGLTKCGQCGSGFNMASANRLSCFGARYKGICDNRLTIRRDDVEARVLKALQEKLLNQELFEESCEEFTREMNRLRMAQRASLSSARREVARIGTRIKRLLNLMLDDEIAVEEGKVEMKALDGRRKELEAQLKTADEPPALLHPEMARIYRTKVTELAKALQQPESRLEAAEALRGLVDAIVLNPDRSKGELGIEPRGNLAAMLGATVQKKRSPESDDLSLQVSLVEGACSRRYLQLWNGAA